MNIPKAIEELEIHQAEIDCNKTPKLWVANHLGIEALKRTRQARVRKEPYWGALLPGETED